MTDEVQIWLTQEFLFIHHNRRVSNFFVIFERNPERNVSGWALLQEWNRWEDNCGRLGRLLDELEVCIGGAEAAQAEDNEESHIERRRRACQVSQQPVRQKTLTVRQ